MSRTVFDSIYDVVPNKTSDPIALVMLPGAGMHARDFMAQGFITPIRDRGLAVDVVMVDIEADGYMHEAFNEHLKNEVVEPLLARGYRRVWFAGISLGAYGAIRFLREKVKAVEGMMLLSPFLSTRGAVGKVLREGGLDHWCPHPRDHENDDWEMLCWLKENLVPDGFPVTIHVGWGASDRYADAGRLLAGRLPSERVFCIPGDHDWHTWNTLWHDMLDALTFPFPDVPAGSAWQQGIRPS